MKKKHLILGMLCLAIPACLPENKTGPVAMKPSVNPSTMASVPVSPSPAPIPSPTTKTYETVENNGGRCLNIDFEQVKPALKYPVDLAVSLDGSKLYILNKRCADYRSTRPPLNEEPFLFSDCSPYPENSQEAPRAYIYEFDTAKKELKLLTIAGKPPLSCEIGEDIEIDSQGRLYVNTPGNHRIYRIDIQKQQVELLSELLIVQKSEGLPTLRPAGESFQLPYLSGPASLYLENNDVYFSMSGPSNTEFTINKLNNKENHQIILSLNGGGNGFPLFSVFHQQVFYWGDTPLFPPYPVNSTDLIERLSPLDYPRETLLSNGSRIGDIKMNASGHIFQTNISQHSIVRLIPDLNKKSADISLLAGKNLPGLQDGLKQNAQFKFPMGLATDANNNLYVADTGNHAIRRITPDGTVTTLYKEPDPHGG